MTDVVIVGAARTPIGAFSGALSSVPATYLGTAAITESLKRAKVEPGEVTEVILGQILTAGAVVLIAMRAVRIVGAIVI